MSQLDQDLVVRSLNYHGQQLTSFLQDNPEQFRSLDLRKVNYQVYHSRMKELRMEDRGKRLLLHRFVAQNMDGLFSQSHTHAAAEGDDKIERTSEEADLTATVPPMESFLDVDRDSRIGHFFEIVSSLDVVFCKIVAKNMTGLLLMVLGFSPVTGKSRYLEDLRLKCFCPTAETISAENHGYNTGDNVCVTILEVKREAQRLLVSMKAENLPESVRHKVQLGLVSQSEMPIVLEMTKQAVEGKVPYEDFLRKSSGFLNPSNVQQLTKELGLSSKGCSMLPSMRHEPPADLRAQTLRKKQNAQWAYKHVASGIGYFKAGNNIEAFQCLNQALKIDPENVEGLVGRGALYANNGGLEKAITDFEEALKIKPDHRNARKYLCETLMAMAKSHEGATNNIEALQCLNQALKIDPENVEGLLARGALCANNGDLEKAVADFEEALKIRPDHRNGRKYLCETLVAVAKGHEKEGRMDLAAAVYQRVMVLAPTDQEPTQAASGIRMAGAGHVAVAGFAMGGGRLQEVLAQGESQGSKEEKKKKRRRRSHRRGSSSSSSSSSSRSSSSSSSSSASASDSGSRKRSSRKKKKKKKSRSSKKPTSDAGKGVDQGKRSLSPFSQKMVPPSIGIPFMQPFGVNPLLQAGFPVAGTSSLPFQSKMTTAGAPGEEQRGNLEEKLRSDFSIPPPGFSQNPYSLYGQQATGYPGQGPLYPAPPPVTQKSKQEEDYDRKVQEFLRQTSTASSSSKGATPAAASTSHQRSRSKSRGDSRSQGDPRRRSRSGERSKSGGGKSDNKKSSSEKKKKKTDEDRLKDKSVKELVKMGFAQDMDVDVFAEKLSKYLNSGKRADSSSKETVTTKKDEKKRKFEEDARRLIEAKKQTRDQEIYVEGMNILVKELKTKKEEEPQKRRLERSPPPLNRIASPGVKAAFDMFEDGSPTLPKKSDAEMKPAAIWKPAGKDSLREALEKKALDTVSRIEERVRNRKSRFGQDDVTRINTNMEFVVQLDPVSGMYVRRPKHAVDQPLSAQSQQEVYREKRIVRKYSGSPPRSPGRERSNSRNRDHRQRRRSGSRGDRQSPPPRGDDQRSGSRGRQFSRSRLSRSRSRERHRGRSTDYGHFAGDSDIQDMMSESLGLQKEREQIEREKAKLLAQQREMDESMGMERSRPHPSSSSTKTKPSPDRRRSRSRGRGQQQRQGRDSRSKSPATEVRGNTSKKAPSVAEKKKKETSSSLKMPDKKELEGKWADDDSSSGNAYMDDVMKSVLDAVDGKKEGSSSREVPKTIIPGAKSFEDIEAYLDAAKKQKKDEMKERNKGFVKPKKMW